jgi:hypothetical protein
VIPPRCPLFFVPSVLRRCNLRVRLICFELEFDGIAVVMQGVLRSCSF